MSCVRIDIFNNINFNQAAEEVLLFSWELMKRKRHTYGTLFLFLCVSSFDLRPDPYAIWESTDDKIQEFNAFPVFLQMQLKNQKRTPSLVSYSPLGT